MLTVTQLIVVSTLLRFTVNTSASVTGHVNDMGHYDVDFCSNCCLLNGVSACPMKCFILVFSLHYEIIDFYNYMSPTPTEHYVRQQVVQRIKHVILALWPHAQVNCTEHDPSTVPPTYSTESCPSSLCSFIAVYEPCIILTAC